MDAVESYRERAPRLRLAALVVVGLVVLGLLAFAVLTAGRTATVTGITVPSGRMCAVLGQQIWTSVDTVVAPDVAAVTLEGRWTSIDAATAQLTTSAGQVIEMRAEPQDPASAGGGATACAIR